MVILSHLMGLGIKQRLRGAQAIEKQLFWRAIVKKICD